MQKLKLSLQLREIILASFFTAITIVMGFISIPLPFSPVPITGQTLALMLSGTLLTPLTAFFSMITYILLGAIGIPIFAGFHGGLSVLIGPTGGYLLAMPISSLVISLILRSKNNSLIRIILANIFGGILIVYSIGIPQLAIITGISLNKALLLGLYPYLIGDIIKVLIASYLALKIKPLLYL